MNYNANQYEPYQTYQSESTFFFAPMTPQKTTKKKMTETTKPQTTKKHKKHKNLKKKTLDTFVTGLKPTSWCLLGP